MREDHLNSRITPSWKKDPSFLIAHDGVFYLGEVMPKRQYELHGMRSEKIYSVWAGMIERCRNPKNKRYKHYGGRGIGVCERWANSFVSFFSDMGYPPSGLTLERKDNNKGYYKRNCKWATHKEQSRNRTSNRIIEYKGQRKSLIDWSEILGFDYDLIYVRLYRDESPESAFHRPVKKNITGITGVYHIAATGKYRAMIGADAKLFDLGTFETIEEATEARRQGEIKYWGKGE